MSFLSDYKGHSLISYKYVVQLIFAENAEAEPKFIENIEIEKQTLWRKKDKFRWSDILHTYWPAAFQQTNVRIKVCGKQEFFKWEEM